MRAEVFGAVVCVCGTVLAVKHFERTDVRGGEPAETAFVATPGERQKGGAYADPAWGREVRIAGGDHNQFFVTAAVNRQPASFLVDTGASYVALRERDANLAGIYPSWSDFDHPVRTANGETKAALVTIDAIEIDGLRVEDVKAFILPDDQLGMNLLGMSFLSQLGSVEARAGELILRG